MNNNKFRALFKDIRFSAQKEILDGINLTVQVKATEIPFEMQGETSLILNAIYTEIKQVISNEKE